MGYTQIFTCGKPNLRKECEALVTNLRGDTIKSVMQGRKFFALQRYEDKDYIIVFLCSIEGHSFFYKDVEIEGTDDFLVPLSLLKEFQSNTEELKQWKDRQLQKHFKAKKERDLAKSLKINDIIKCCTRCNIFWGNHVLDIKDDEEFFAIIDNIGGRQVYRIAEFKNGKFSKTNFLIKRSSFKIIEKI